MEKARATHSINDWVALQQRRVWQWAGKVARAKDGRWSHEVLFWNPELKRKQGRPCTRWSDLILTFLHETFERDVGDADWISLAQDEHLWNDLEEQFCKYAADPY